ncbi:Sec-independent protein translocase protein TatB [Pinisolibacter sp.]|uniref:Sec-independent protein translocase protein TatB n=1 Tax=Pinisolibacter sp. TaxID=2172024 RepID=UPI002FDDBA46
MLDIGWSELVIIGVVALVVVGPKELPTLLRTVGQWVGKARRMASEFQGQLNDAIREAELEDVKKSVDDLRSLNPTKLVTDQLASIGDDVKRVGSAVEADWAGAPSGAGSAMSAFTAADEAGLTAGEAEKLIDAAAPQVDDTVFDLTPAPMPAAAPAPVEAVEAPAAAESEPDTDKKATGA